jgi:tetratricopeptide (TPR) repeat protein
MRAQSFARSLFAIPVVGLLIAGAAGLQWVRERRYPPPPIREASVYLTSGTAVRRLTAGFNALAADLYWIRAIQYYGDVKLRLGQAPEGETTTAPADFELLYPLLDLTTTLDPRFNIAYRFGSIFLAEAYPAGAGRPDLAIALLEKGLRDQPDKWEYMQDIGFVHYWWRHDYRAAAEWFDKASRVSGAPWFLRSLAATTVAEGGDRQSSRLMWEAIRESAEIDWLRNDAERRLQQLDAADRIDRAQRAIDKRVVATGSRPTDWQTLVRAGVFPGVPLDPTGTPLLIDAEGRVHLSPQSPLFPLAPEPMRIAPPRS